MYKHVGLVLCVGAVLFVGCATMGSGPSDEELLSRLTDECLAAGQAQDIDKMMTYFSEYFDHYEFGDKEGMRQYMQGVKDMGYLDGVQISAADAKITVQGDSANIYPIDMDGNFGSAVIEIDAKKEKDGWKVVSMDISF